MKWGGPLLLFPLDTLEDAAVIGGECGVVEEVGAVEPGLAEGLLAPPAADGGVVAAGEDIGHLDAAEDGGAGVVGIVEQAAGAVDR